MSCICTTSVSTLSRLESHRKCQGFTNMHSLRTQPIACSFKYSLAFLFRTKRSQEYPASSRLFLPELISLLIQTRNPYFVNFLKNGNKGFIISHTVLSFSQPVRAWEGWHRHVLKVLVDFPQEIKLTFELSRMGIIPLGFNFWHRAGFGR